MTLADDILLDLDVRTKAALMHELAEVLARRARQAVPTVLGALRAREALGSTGIGRGIAVPHARMPGLVGPASCFLRLARPIAFDAVDGQPVDLVFALVGPSEGAAEHLASLAAVTRRLRDADVAARCRAARTVAEMAGLFAAD